MKLERLHIENFGKLSHFDYEFTDGINVICKENSFGKTTLGTFIKVMFFGFEKESSRIADRERTKYRPWQGGTYGGTIVFEVDNKRYEMSRVFKERVADDEFVLRDADTLLPSDDYSKEKIGIEIFSVDAGSFERTMFVSQNKYEYGDKNDIDAKIGNLVDDTDGIHNFETATKAINDTVAAITKRKGNSGELDKIRSQIAEYTNDVRRKPQLDNSMNDLVEKINELDKRIEDNKAKIRDYGAQIDEQSEYQTMMNSKIEYDALRENYDRFAPIYNKEIMYFNGTLPDGSQLNEAIRKADRLAEYRTVMGINKLSEDEEIRLQSLNSRYSDKHFEDIPFRNIEADIRKCTADKQTIEKLDLTDDEKSLLEKEELVFDKGFSYDENSSLIRQWDEEREFLKRNVDSLQLTVTEVEKIDALSKLYENNEPDKEQINYEKQEWANRREGLIDRLRSCKLSQNEEEELSRLKSLFSGKDIDEIKLDDYIAKSAEITSDSSRIKDLQRELDDLKATQGNKTVLSPLFIIGLCIAVIGLLVAFAGPNIVKDGTPLSVLYPNLQIIGFCVAALGVLLLVVSLFMSGKTKTKQNSEKTDKLNSEMQETEQKKTNSINDMNQFLSQFGKTYDDNILLTLNNLDMDIKRYKMLSAQYESNQEETESIRGQIKEIEDRVKALLDRYHYDFDETTVLYHIKEIIDDYNEYKNLLERRRSLNTRQSSDRERILSIEARCRDYFARYGLEYAPSNVSSNLHDLDRRYRVLTDLRNKRDNDQLASYKEEFAELSERIKAFFKEYLDEDVNYNDYYSSLSSLEKDAQESIGLNDKKGKYEKALNDYNIVKDELSRYIRSFSFPVGQDIKGQLVEMQNHYQTLTENIQLYKEAKERKEEFEKKNLNYRDLITFDKVIDDSGIKSLNEKSHMLQSENEGLKSRRDALNNQLDDINEQYELLCEKEDQLTVLKEKEAILAEKVLVLNKTNEFLKKAKENLNAKYTAPLNNSLKRYFGILTKDTDLSISIDVNKNLIIKSNGKETAEGNLSEGYKDIVDICYRFALIDAMYPDEQPIVVLDDPFINLDEEKTANGLRLLSEIASEKQILYLTCHDSRTIPPTQ